MQVDWKRRRQLIAERLARVRIREVRSKLKEELRQIASKKEKAKSSCAHTVCGRLHCRSKGAMLPGAGACGAIRIGVSRAPKCRSFDSSGSGGSTQDDQMIWVVLASQFADGRSMWSMTMTSTGPFEGMSLSPSCSSSAVKIEGRVSDASAPSGANSSVKS
jgi:hypothetical protein